MLSYFPNYIKEKFSEVSNEEWKKAKEIRIRNNRPIIISGFDNEKIIDYKVQAEDILRIVENFSDNSLYKVQNEINEGFITIKGGHRVGITGTSVIEAEKIKNIKYISGLKIRIAREVKGCSNELLEILDEELDSTIIISPPRMWKNNFA